MQAVTNSISDLIMSQNKTRAIGILFCLRKILIKTEFALFSVGQRVCIKSRGISEQESVHYQLVYWCTIFC